jgi:hypothetical protein
MKCALIEFNAFHDEVLPTFVHLLNKLGITPDVYIPDIAIRRNAFAFATDLRYQLHSTDGIGRLRGTPSRLRTYDVVIVNSLEPRSNLNSLQSSRLPTLGVVHNANLLLDEPEYRGYFEGRDRQPLVLGRHIANYLGRHSRPTAWIAHVFFGDVPPVRRPETDPITLSVSGNLEYARRNFASLLDAAEALDRDNSRFRVRMIGRSNTVDGARFRRELETREIGRYFSFSPDEIDHEAYLSTLAGTDFVLPLLDRSAAEYRPYYDVKLSSSISLAIGLGVPMVAEETLSKRYGVESATIAYRDGDLADALRSAIASRPAEQVQRAAALATIRSDLLEASTDNLAGAISAVIGATSTSPVR